MIKRFAIRMAWVILGLVGLALVAVWTYVLLNKPAILRKLTAELNARVKGEVRIGDIDFSFFHSFPDISVRLSTVSVRDSLWQRHQRPLLDAKKIFVQISPFSLFSNDPPISKIMIEEGSVYIFSDSDGYTNLAILRPDELSKKKGSLSLARIGLRDLRLVIDESYRRKLFEFHIQKLDCESTTEENFLRLRANGSFWVDSMAFNMDKGSFLKGKQVEGKMKMQFNPSSKILQFDNIKLQIDHQPFGFSGKFFLGEEPPPFQLSINAEKIFYATATALLPQNIAEKLDKYNILNPFSVSCVLDATSTESRDPLIKIKLKTENNGVITPAGSFSTVSFSGSFTNQWAQDRPRGDENSRFLFSSFSGKWENFSFQSDSILISNLDRPLLNCDLHSLFDLTTLNELSGSKAIHFEKGNGRLDLVYQGPLENADSIQAQINGNIRMTNASIYYLPRDFLLSGCNGTIRFKGQDLYIDELQASAGSTRLKMSGNAKNLLSLISKGPEKAVLDWNIYSESLNLHDFISFLGNHTDAISAKKEKSSLVKTGEQIDRLLKDCTVRVHLSAGQLVYKKFFARNLAATVWLAHNQVQLQNVILDHAGGSLTLKGSIQNSRAGNAISIQSQMQKVDLPKVFTAFNNFGQTAIVDKNLEGKLNADIKITGVISNTADLDPNSLLGTIEWNIENGRLIQFEPLEKISKIAFKNRSFDDIYFADLKDEFEIRGTEIKINRMEIQSTALTMFAEGLYDVKKGADISIQIPFSNLQSKKRDSIPMNKGIHSKTGISLLLRAKTASDGKLNISWDPFRRALKK